MRDSCLLIDFVVVVLCSVLMCSSVLSCTPEQRRRLAAGAWSAADCGLHSSLGCAGQASGACSIPSVSDDSLSWGAYAECIGSVSQSCMVSSLAKCAFAGLAATVSGPIVAGSSGCGSEEHSEAVQLCISREDVEDQRGAVEASAMCWRSICGI
jgi:hypothetical protein